MCFTLTVSFCCFNVGVIATGYFCKERGFPPAVSHLAGQLVQVTRSLWQATKFKMLSTPAKFHYIFNLRDLSRIWEGMVNVTSEIITETSHLMTLWKHECCRVISDRFVCEEDKEWFEAAMSRTAGDLLGAELREQIPEEPYFVDFLREAPEPTGDEADDADLEPPKIYEMVHASKLIKCIYSIYTAADFVCCRFHLLMT